MDTPTKTCSACSADVTTAKRFKDSKGRVFCAACAESLRAKARAHGHAIPAVASVAPAPHEPDDGTIAIADEAPARDEGFLRKPAHRAGGRDLELCPDCATPWGSSVICTKCGLNRATGLPVGIDAPGPAGADPIPRSARPPKPCTKCGYDLTGLRTARCPECGTVNPRLKRGQKSERQTLREMYLTPLIMTAIGVSLVLLVQFAVGAIKGGTGISSGVAVGGTAALVYLILFPILLIVGFFAYVACSMMFVGFDEPLGVTFVRLAAVYAITDAVESVVQPIPVLNWFSWFIVGTVYLGLLMQIMELDWDDAWLVAVVTFIAKILIAAIAYWIWFTYF